MAKVLSPFSRRNMLIGLAGGAAATAVASKSAFAAVLRPASAGSNAALARASYRDWSAQVGSTFTARSGHELTLVEVESVPNKGALPSRVRSEAFVARFDVAKGGELPEDLYRIAHPSSGTLDVFLTKAGPDAPQRMLAVFA